MRPEFNEPTVISGLCLLLILVFFPGVFLQILRFSSLHKKQLNTSKLQFHLQTVQEYPLYLLFIVKVVKDFLWTSLVVVKLIYNQMETRRILFNNQKYFLSYFTGGQMGKNFVSHFRSHWNDTNSPATMDVFRGWKLVVVCDSINTIVLVVTDTLGNSL